MARIFLCHAIDDKPQVRVVYQRLKALGFEPWLDEMDILPGQDWNYEIENALETSDFVIVFLSTRSVAKIGYVNREIQHVLYRSQEMPEGFIYTIPVKLDDCAVPRRFSPHQWANLYEEGAFDRIVSALHHGLQQRGQPLPKPLILDPPIIEVLEDTDHHAEGPTVANAVIEAINPLLSEFDNKWFKWIGLFLSSPWGKWIIACLACVTTAITIHLGSLAKANCISVYLRADSKEANLLFGYLAELNHALTYLVLVPAFIVIVFMFLIDFGSALQRLEIGGRVKWKSSDGTIRDYPPHALSLRETNKRIFIAVTPACLAIALLHVYLDENPTYNAGTFGWVQTGFASEWSKRIGPNNQAKTLQDLKFPLIPPAVMQKLSVNEKDTDKVFILNVVGGSQTPKEKNLCHFFSLSGWELRYYLLHL